MESNNTQPKPDDDQSQDNKPSIESSNDAKAAQEAAPSSDSDQSNQSTEQPKEIEPSDTTEAGFLSWFDPHQMAHMYWCFTVFMAVYLLQWGPIETTVMAILTAIPLSWKIMKEDDQELEDNKLDIAFDLSWIAVGCFILFGGFNVLIMMTLMSSVYFLATNKNTKAIIQRKESIASVFKSGGSRSLSLTLPIVGLIVSLFLVFTVSPAIMQSVESDGNMCVNPMAQRHILR